MSSTATSSSKRPVEADRDLVARLRAGHPDAFATFYRTYHDRLLLHLKCRTRDSGLAEDVAHDALLRAARSIDRFDVGRPLWPWLKTIANNRLIDVLRRDARVRVTADVVVAPYTDSTDTIDERALLVSALALLPIRQRTALTLSYVHGLPAADAARRLGISRNAFDQLLHRARAALRAQYVALEPEAAGRLRMLLWPPLAGWLRRRRDRVASIFNTSASVPASFGVADTVLPVLVATVMTLTASPATASMTSFASADFDGPPASVAHAERAYRQESSSPDLRPPQTRSVRSLPREVRSPEAHVARDTAAKGPVERAREGERPSSVGLTADGVEAAGHQGITRDQDSVEAASEVEASAAGKQPRSKRSLVMDCNGPTREKLCEGAETVGSLPDRLPPPPVPRATDQ